MNATLYKLLRTAQSEVPFVKTAKDAFYYQYRRILHQPHDSDFRALRFIPDSLEGIYLDVGANHGQSIESILAIKQRAQIVSFEANQLLANRLQKRYRYKAAVKVEGFGLAETNSSQTLFVPVYNGFVYDGLASMDRGSAESWLCPERLYFFRRTRLKIQDVPCIIRRLDELSLQPILVKIDVQGLEASVVRGGLETLRRHEPILLIEDFYRDPNLEKLLAPLGYQQYLFDTHGFYPQRSTSEINTFSMTPGMAAKVTQSRARSSV